MKTQRTKLKKIYKDKQEKLKKRDKKHTQIGIERDNK